MESTASFISISASGHKSGYFYAGDMSSSNFSKGLVESSPLGRIEDRHDRDRQHDRRWYDDRKLSHLGSRGERHHHSHTHQRPPPYKKLCYDSDSLCSPWDSLRHDNWSHRSSHAHSTSTAGSDTWAKSHSSQKGPSSQIILMQIQTTMSSLMQFHSPLQTLKVRTQYMYSSSSTALELASRGCSLMTSSELTLVGHRNPVILTLSTIAQKTLSSMRCRIYRKGILDGKQLSCNIASSKSEI